MKNLFLSPTGLLKNVYNKLDAIQTELRHQRSDNATILRTINKMFVELNLQKQAEEYYQEKLPLEDNMKDIPDDSRDLD